MTDSNGKAKAGDLQQLLERIERMEDRGEDVMQEVVRLSGRLAQATQELRDVRARLEGLARARPGRLASLRQSLGSLRHDTRAAILRPRIRMTPKIDKQLEPGSAPGSFVSLGDDPSFLLEPEGGRFPSGWVLIEAELSSEDPLVHTPAIYLDHGAGFSEVGLILLPRPVDGMVRALVPFTPPVVGLRFDPLAQRGGFRLGAVTMQELGKLEAAARLGLPIAKEALADPKRALRAFNTTLETLRSGGLHGLRQKLRARAFTRSNAYEEWVALFDTLSDGDRASIRQRIGELARRPKISLVMPVYQTPEPWLRRALESVRAQLYQDWELCIADDASKAPHVRRILEDAQASDPRIKVVFRERNGHISEASNSALELATGEFIALLDHDDELPEHALYLVAEELDAHPDADLVYSDEDKLDEKGRRFDPYFKPEWDPDLFSSQNYFSHLGVYRATLVREVGGFRAGFEGSQDYDLALRCIEKSARVRHIPHVLYHWRAVAGSTARAEGEKSYAQDAAERALAEHFAKVDPGIEVLAGPLPTTYRVKRPLPASPPLASLLIPTRDGFEILQRCIESVFARTDYPRFEIVIVDNQSQDKATLDYLRALETAGRARVLRYDAPFNYSAINNFAVREAGGEVLCLLNNDVETIGEGWLTELVSQALRPEIGAVGCKLLYPDSTLQHAGVISGLGGVAGHAFKRRARDASGYFHRAQLLQRLSVVTAACLCVRREVYEEVGGLDEVNLSVAFNDVDFCLRVREAGYANLYTPFAELFHHESYSRGSDEAPAKRARFLREIRYMQERWARTIQRDPAYSPNLSLDTEQFDLAFPPRVEKPWGASAPGQQTQALGTSAV